MLPSNPNNSNRSSDPVDRDLLITRLLDARSSDADWLAFRDFASLDQSVWSDLVAARRDMARLERAMEPVASSADLCPMPELRFDGERARASRNAWSSRRGLIGWAVAAVLAIGFVAQQAGFKPVTPSQPQSSAGLVNMPQNPPELLAKYIE